jgi:hypothetical protein
MGFKCPSFAGAYCCHRCHDLVDSRRYADIPKWQVMMAFYEAVLETQMKLVEKGLIKIDG